MISPGERGWGTREMAWARITMVIALVLSLAAVRIIAVRYSPRRGQEEL